MNSTAKFLIFAGLALVAMGALWHFGATYLKLGRLPGDIDFKINSVRIYFPIVTCILLSLVLSLAIAVFQWFRH